MSKRFGGLATNLRAKFLALRINRIGGGKVSVLTLSAVDHWLGPRLCHTKDFKMAFASSPC
jgi:hypothetical protein